MYESKRDLADRLRLAACLGAFVAWLEVSDPAGAGQMLTDQDVVQIVRAAGCDLAITEVACLREAMAGLGCVGGDA